jgi:hypothetical protein
MKVEGWDGRWARTVLAWRRLKDVVLWVGRAVKVRRARRMGVGRRLDGIVNERAIEW